MAGLYFCRRIAVAKFAWWTWILMIGFMAFAFDAVVHGRQEIAHSGEFVLALASAAFAYDVFQDIKTRGYRLPQLRP